VLFVWTVVAIVRPALHAPAVRPVVWALVAVLVSKVISAPDLADPSGILYLCLGVLAWQGVQTRRARRLTLEGAPEAFGGRRAARLRNRDAENETESEADQEV
jgi:hypothetical protein